jgi:integrase
MTKPNKRAPNGEASIVVRSGYLRLRIPASVHPSGTQKEIALNMADTHVGRTIAAQILAKVQLDTYNGELDPTLDKYKRKEIAKQPTVYDVWCQYVTYKEPTIKQTTLHYYREIVGDKLRDCPQSIVDALEVRTWLLKNTSKFYAARILKHLCSAVEWGIEYKGIDLAKNPYSYMAKEIAPKSHPPGADALTLEEKEAVLNAFLTAHHFDHYYPFVYFLFITGCRPSEAIGLRWGDLCDDGDGYLSINFSGAIVQIKSKPVRTEKSKTNRVRKFPVNTELQDLIEAVWKDHYTADQLIFPSRESPNKPINYINFCQRGWNEIVDPILGRHVTPYSCRDTFITEQIAANIPISVVAAWVDNSPLMISTRYFDVSTVDFMPQ